VVAPRTLSLPLLALAALLCVGAGARAGDAPPRQSGTQVVVTLAAPPLAEATGGGARATARIEREQAAFLAALRARMPDATVRWRYRLVANGLAVVVAPREVGRLRGLPGVRDVYPATSYAVARTQANAGPARVGAQALWGPALATAGQGVKIGIIDTGIDQSHPYFSPAGYTMPPGFPKGDRRYTTAKVIVARSFPAPGYEHTDARLPVDEDGHGTHVAGIAAGNADVPTDTDERLSGIAPRAYLGNYRALAVDDAVSGSNGTAAELVAAIEAAVADGMDVINLSLGEAEVDPTRDIVALALDAAAQAGVVPVVVAGNEAESYGRGSIFSPGSSERAITVGALDIPDRGPPTAAGFSSVGPSPLSLRLKPDVAAPGVGVLSAAPGGGWATSSGSSMAGPHVTGIAALLRQRHPEWTPAQVKEAIVDTAVPVKATPSPTRVGAGLVDASAADRPLVGASPTSLSFGLVPVGTTASGDVSLEDLGGGAGAWTTRLQRVSPTRGAAIAVPSTVEVPGTLRLTMTAAPGALAGDLSGVLVLSRDGVTRRVPFWGRVTSPKLGTEPVTRLTRPGVYRGTTRGRSARVRSYRYPDRAPGVPALMRGPERVYRVVLDGPVANFGVAVTHRAAGVTVQPRVVQAGDENRLTGWPGLPVAVNPYLDTYGDPLPVAGAVRPAAGAFDVVFDSPTAAGAGAFTFRLWVDDRTPPRARLLTGAVTTGDALQVRVSDGGAGVDPGALAAEIDGASVSARLRNGIVRLRTAGLAPGRHRLRLQVSDYQESRNTENVPAILPNTRVLKAGFVVRAAR
jgi:subtilisin family serine protease